MTRCLTLSLAVLAMMLFTGAVRADDDVNDMVKHWQPPKDSKEFAMKAAQGGMLEVQASQLAQQKASTNEIKELAKQIEQDHKQADSELMAIAQKKNIDLPNELKGEAKDCLEVLQKLDGKAFDNAYLIFLVSDHLMDVPMFQQEARTGTDPDIKQWAAKTVPTLREHTGKIGTVAQAAGLPIDALTGGHGARPAGAEIPGSNVDKTPGNTRGDNPNNGAKPRTDDPNSGNQNK